jgi:hypothetical protein
VVGGILPPLATVAGITVEAELRAIEIWSATNDCGPEDAETSTVVPPGPGTPTKAIALSCWLKSNRG